MWHWISAAFNVAFLVIFTLEAVQHLYHQVLAVTPDATIALVGAGDNVCHDIVTSSQVALQHSEVLLLALPAPVAS